MRKVYYIEVSDKGGLTGPMIGAPTGWEGESRVATKEESSRMSARGGYETEGALIFERRAQARKAAEMYRNAPFGPYSKYTIKELGEFKRDTSRKVQGWAVVAWGNVISQFNHDYGNDIERGERVLATFDFEGEDYDDQPIFKKRADARRMCKLIMERGTRWKRGDYKVTPIYA